MRKSNFQLSRKIVSSIAAATLVLFVFPASVTVAALGTLDMRLVAGFEVNGKRCHRSMPCCVAGHKTLPPKCPTTNPLHLLNAV
mmetsp:Transcript_7400/g.11388  ORF Transcript_7400/g.11388 Transcript_7400/m.11388 type:complete len:84 (+) Transcript_7400:181-432(+)